MTIKTVNYITFLLESEMENLIKRIPKNTEKYNDTRVNNQRLILEEALEKIEQKYANTIISFIRKNDEVAVEQFIFGIMGIKGIK